MSAKVLFIEQKFRANPLQLASLEDFTYTEGESLPAQVVVEQPNLSLYCLDEKTRQAIFVETPPDIDLAQAPFYYQAQFEHAYRLVALPYEALHSLARSHRPPDEALILIYSVGRCGSTLVSQLFNLPDNVLSLSEPDVFTQIVLMREPDGSRDEELAALLAGCVAVLAKASPQKRPAFWALKFRAFCIEIADLLYRNYPQAKLLFLYRQAESWARSSARVFLASDQMNEAKKQEVFHLMNRLVPMLPAYMASTPGGLSATDLLVLIWLSVMKRYMSLHAQGCRTCAARYEDLKARPEAVLQGLFRYCGLPLPDPAALEQILAKDSQANSHLSQARVQQYEAVFGEAELAQLRAFLQAEPVINRQDFVVPGTLFHGRGNLSSNKT
jgi:hypothetical protein